MQPPCAVGIALIITVACYDMQVALDHGHSMRRSLCTVPRQACLQSLAGVAADCLPCSCLSIPRSAAGNMLLLPDKGQA